MHEVLPNYAFNHIRNKLRPVIYQNVMDKPWWTKNTNGQFSDKSAWELLKHKVYLVQGVAFYVLFSFLKNLVKVNPCSCSNEYMES